MIRSGLPHLGDLLQERKEILHAADLLFVDEDVGIFQHHFHPFRVGDKIRGDVAAVELHAFHHFQSGLHALGFFDGDNALFAHLVHGFGDDVADGSVVVGADGADLSDFFWSLVGLLSFLSSSTAVTTAFSMPRLRAMGLWPAATSLEPFAVNGLGQDGGGGGAVAGHIGSLAGDLLNHLGAHVFELVLQFDFLGHRDAVFGDGGGTPGLVEHHVTTLGSEGDFNCIGQGVNPLHDLVPGLAIVFDFLCSHEPILLSSISMVVLLKNCQDIILAHD